MYHPFQNVVFHHRVPHPPPYDSRQIFRIFCGNLESNWYGDFRLIKVGYVEGRAQIGVTYNSISNFSNASAILSALEEKGFIRCLSKGRKGRSRSIYLFINEWWTEDDRKRQGERVKLS